MCRAKKKLLKCKLLRRHKWVTIAVSAIPDWSRPVAKEYTDECTCCGNVRKDCVSDYM